MLILRCNDPEPRMSLVGQQATSAAAQAMSALTSMSDIDQRAFGVRNVPKGDIDAPNQHDGFGDAASISWNLSSAMTLMFRYDQRENPI